MTAKTLAKQLEALAAKYPGDDWAERYAESLPYSAALLRRTADNHHAFEATTLKGKRDKDWASWYAFSLLYGPMIATCVWRSVRHSASTN